MLAGFVGWERHTENPLLDPRLFARPAFAAGTISIGLQFFAFFGFVFVTMQYLQLVRGDSPLLASVSVLPMAAGMMPAARFAPKVVEQVGARACCVTGLALVAAGLGALAAVGATSSYWLFAAALVPLGAGMGLAMTPATTAITDSLPPALQGVGSAMNDLSRELGGALGIAVMGSLLSSTYADRLTLPGVSAPLADKARSSLAVAARLDDPVLTQARGAFVDGMHVAILAGAGAALIAAVSVAFLLHRPVDDPRTDVIESVRDTARA